MRLLIENRVEQALRHLQPKEAARITKVIELLESVSFEELRVQFKIDKLASLYEQVFVLRATARFRILFKYGDDKTLIVEDIVSHEMLEKLFRERRI